MGEVVNLRLARKRRQRAEEKGRASENRVRYGRTGGEKAATRAEAERAARTAEGHRLDRSEGNPDDGAEGDGPGGRG